MFSWLYLLVSLLATAYCDDPAILYLVDNPANTSQHTVLTEARSLQLNLNFNTVFAVHGWKGDVNWTYFPIIASAFFNRSLSYNFIIVDWGKYAKQLYWDAIPDSEKVSKYVSKFIANLTSRGLNESRVHLIGHSLGAHLVGNIGSNYKKNNKKSLNRITALDPAGPLFGALFSGLRLSKTDAEAVIVLHTNAGYNGYEGALGTSDFYANGGGPDEQPPCKAQNASNANSCSHQIAAAYFAESINSNGFVGSKCQKKLLGGKTCNDSNTAIFGPDTPASVSGRYYFDTNSYPPYAQG